MGSDCNNTIYWSYRLYYMLLLPGLSGDIKASFTILVLYEDSTILHCQIFYLDAAAESISLNAHMKKGIATTQ